MDPQQPGFRWNAGGWFGTQLGGTSWILVATILVFPRDAGAALSTLAVFAAVNVIGTLMWAQRSRLRPFPAIQWLIVFEGIASMLATFILDSAGHFESLGRGGQVSAPTMYLMLALMVPGLLVFFYLIERGNRARSG